jgi:hypothetical protein
MEPTINPMVLGVLMIAFTSLWFGLFSWAGMHEDDTPRGPTRHTRSDGVEPWWTHDGFGDLGPEHAQELARTGHARH